MNRIVYLSCSHENLTLVVSDVLATGDVELKMAAAQVDQ